MAAVHYREAYLADVPRLVRLPREGEAGGDHRMAQYLAGQHHPQHALLPRAMWMAADGESPIGYVAGHLTRRFGCDGELQWIYVVPEHRRSQVASRLLRLLAEWFLEHGAWRICVNVGDDEARPFYTRHGAVELNRHWIVWNDIGGVVERGACMEMAYRERWEAEIAEMRRVLAGLAMKEECKWGKPTYTVDGKNIVIMQGFKEYFALGFFQGALLKDPKKVLVQLGQVHAGRVMKFTSAKDITAKAATIKAYVREAIAVEKAGLRMKPKKTSDFPVPEELSERFRKDPRFKRAFEALTPGRQRSYLYHFAAAKQSATRAARIEKAMPAIFEGRGFLERR